MTLEPQALKAIEWADLTKYESVQNWMESLAENNDDLKLATGTINGIKTWFPRFIRSPKDEKPPQRFNP